MLAGAIDRLCPKIASEIHVESQVWSLMTKTTNNNKIDKIP
jgi:hypothetical protein